MRKLFYQSVNNPSIVCNTADECEALYNSDPLNPDFIMWVNVLTMLPNNPDQGGANA